MGMMKTSGILYGMNVRSVSALVQPRTLLLECWILMISRARRDIHIMLSLYDFIFS
jgi:hypothetical protein